MEVRFNDNLIVINGEERNIKDCLTSLGALSANQIVSLFQEHQIKYPHVLQTEALRYILNEKVKVAKTLGLSDEMMYRLRFYMSFSEYQLENFFMQVKTEDLEREYREAFWTLVLKNVNALKITDNIIAQALKLPVMPVEQFLTYFKVLTKVTYDYNKEFDGKNIHVLVENLPKSATANDIRDIGAKYELVIPKRLRKEEMQEIIIQELKKQHKYDDEMAKKVDKLPVMGLQRLAKNNDIKVSVDLKKEDLIAYLFNEVEKAKFETYPRLNLNLDLGSDFVFDLAYVMTQEEMIEEGYEEAKPQEVVKVVEPVKEEVKVVERVVQSEPTVTPQIVTNQIDTEAVVRVLSESIEKTVSAITEKLLPLVQEQKAKPDLIQPIVNVNMTGEKEEPKPVKQPVVEEELEHYYPYNNFTNDLNPLYDEDLKNSLLDKEMENLQPVEPEVLYTPTEEVKTEDMPVVETPVEEPKEQPKLSRKELRKLHKKQKHEEAMAHKALLAGDINATNEEYVDKVLKITQYKMQLEERREKRHQKSMRRVWFVIKLIIFLIFILVLAWGIFGLVCAFSDDLNMTEGWWAPLYNWLLEHEPWATWVKNLNEMIQNMKNN